MAEIEPASDELMARIQRRAEQSRDVDLLYTLARLRKAEADNANMAKLLLGYVQICSEHGIAPPSSEVYAAAERATQGGGNG